MDTRKIAFQRIIETINGNIQAQGIKVNFPAWMVMGSPEWEATPDEIKAYAYQAALVTGWTNDSLTKAVCAVYEHIDTHMAEFTINLLQDLVKEHPLPVVGKERTPPKVTIVDGYGSRDL